MLYFLASVYIGLLPHSVLLHAYPTNSAFSTSNGTENTSGWVQTISAGISSIQTEAPSENPRLLQVISPTYQTASQIEQEFAHPSTMKLNLGITSYDFAYASLTLQSYRWMPTNLGQTLPASLKEAKPMPWPPVLGIEQAWYILKQKEYKEDFERVMLEWRTPTWRQWKRVDQPYWMFFWVKKRRIVRVGMDGSVWVDKTDAAGGLDDFSPGERTPEQSIPDTAMINALIDPS